MNNIVRARIQMIDPLKTLLVQLSRKLLIRQLHCFVVHSMLAMKLYLQVRYNYL